MLLLLSPDIVDLLPLTLSSAGRLRCVCKRLNRSTLNTRAALLDLFCETPDVGNMSTEELQAAAKGFFNNTPILDTSIERNILHTGFMRHVLRTRNAPFWPIIGVDDLQVLYDIEFHHPATDHPPPQENFVLNLLRTRSTLIHTKRGRDAIVALIALWSACSDHHVDFFRAIIECLKNRRVVRDGVVTV